MLIMLKWLIALLFVLEVSSNGIPGGYSEKDPNDTECMRSANAAMALQNAAENGNRAIKKVERCVVQIVAGRNTVLEMEVCNKEDDKYTRCVKCSTKMFEGLKPDQIKLEYFHCLRGFPIEAVNSARGIQK